MATFERNVTYKQEIIDKENVMTLSKAVSIGILWLKVLKRYLIYLEALTLANNDISILQLVHFVWHPVQPVLKTNQERKFKKM